MTGSKEIPDFEPTESNPNVDLIAKVDEFFKSGDVKDQMLLLSGMAGSGP